ncbi:uncharacterized protein LOC130046383 isoform X2 [Ostrea edulis]|uniref:uncharacterized protein LOC130046383 isoform X2 n=1 Tax=Ostrea edulis TaxID=37623 RepID=UPI0024AED86C|nr:uncharacterized protein LOC130046383 isoform X2 [Ostrea edulis]
MGDKACNRRTYTEGLDCCINFFLRNKSCHPCQPGTFGFNCTDHCSPGFYGDLCGQKCMDCLEEECHYTSGCPKMDTTIFATQNRSTVFIQPDTQKSLTVFIQPEFTHSIDSVTCMDRSITNKGVISKMIMINGSLIIALLLVLIIIISVRKFLMFKYWKRKIESDHALPYMIETAYTEADEMPMATDNSGKKRKKQKKKRNAGEKNQSCREENELELMYLKK